MNGNAFDMMESEGSGFDYEAFAQEEASVENGLEQARESGSGSGDGGRKKKAGAEAYDWVQCLVAALLFCVIVFSFFFRIIGIIGPSMQPNFHDGDRVLISKLFYTPEQGDVVVLRKDTFQEEPIIKRVIAIEGQTVEIDFELGIVYVDGVALDEPYTAEPTYTPLEFNGPVTVPENSVFVLGDNRNHSADSRRAAISCVDNRYIIGKVLVKVLPISDFEVIK